MKRLVRRIGRDSRGISAVEFAFVAPVLVLLIVGIAQLGTLFYAHAGLRNAVSEGARFATIHPRPTSDQIVARINANRTTLDEEGFSTPVVSFEQDVATQTWRANISMSYTFELDFLFFESPPITLNYQRRTHVHAPPSA